MAIKIEEKMRRVLRRKHMAYTTEKMYISWYKRFVRYFQMRHPQEMGGAEITEFLTFLAREKHVSAATQNQAFSALLFLYRDVLGIELEGIDALRAKPSKRLPVVLVPEEISRILAVLDGNAKIVVMLLYGCGLRLNECLRLRVRDVDFSARVIRVVSGKGDKDRILKMPSTLWKRLRLQREAMEVVHEKDRLDKQPGVALPRSILNRQPEAGKQWAWFWVFASPHISTDPQTGIRRRHHLHPASLSRALNGAVQQCGIQKRVTAHTFRHSYATQLLLTGVDLRSVQEVLGYSSIKTTEVCTHVVHALQGEVPSPLDALGV